MHKLILVLGIILLIGGGLVATLSVATTIDDNLAASEDIPRKILLPATPLTFAAGETMTTRFTVTGTIPSHEVRMGITTNSSLASVLVNRSIIDDTITLDGWFYDTLDTAEAAAGGLFTFEWSTDSGTPVMFGVFDTDGYLNVTSFMTVETFQANALVWGRLADGIGYLEAPQSDDYFFLILNPNENPEEVVIHVFMVTYAAIPYLDSVTSTTQATLTYTIPGDDVYRFVVELPDGDYTVTFHSEGDPTYPYQLYGILIIAIGAVIAIVGVLRKPAIIPRQPAATSSPPVADTTHLPTPSNRPQFCTHCGHSITASTKFCGNCGTPLPS